MAFGFGIGDFIAVGKLIKDVHDFLNQINQSSSNYQELRRELDNLQKALHHVDKLNSKVDRELLAVVKITALSCQYPLIQFLQKIGKYETSLGPKRVRLSKSLTGWKQLIQWTFLDKEVMQLRHYIGVHVGTINMMLMTHGLEVLNAASAQATENQKGMLAISHEIQQQRGETKSLISQLLGVVMDQILPQISTLVDLAQRVSQSNLDLFNLLFKMQTDVALRTSPTTWFQEPIRFEDACGRIIPIPSEYQYHQVLAVIDAQFATGPTRWIVSSGRYELYNMTNGCNLLTRCDWSDFLPGAYIKMAVFAGVFDMGGCSSQTCAARFFQSNSCGNRKWLVGAFLFE